MERRQRPRVSYRKMLSNKRLRGAFIYRLVNALGRGNIRGFLALFAVQALGVSGTMVGLLLSAGIFAAALLQTPMGVLADRYNKILLVVSGGITASAGYFYIIHAGTLTELFLSRLVISLGGALSLPALTAIAAEEGKSLGAGSTMGVYSTAMSIGQFMGPLFSGVLLDIYGMQAVFNFSAVTGLLSVVAFYILSR